MFLQKQEERVAKFSLPPLNSHLLTPISAGANSKTYCTKAHISPDKKGGSSELGKCSYSYTLSITY